jgi:hypothetical protein
MNTNKISKTTSPFPNIKSDMLDRLSQEADGRIKKAKSSRERSPRKASGLGSRKAVWYRVFFRGNETAETQPRQVPQVQI